jgi:3',5'-cyclic-AMP phosphodiesterase
MDASPNQSGTKPQHQSGVRVIQFTDCHLGPIHSESLLGLNTDQSLEDVLQLIQQNETSIDQLLCTGDIASAGHADGYMRFHQMVRRYFSQPLAWLPGNHDSAEIMSSSAKALNIEPRLVSVGNWLIVMLDSSVSEQVYGHLESSELDYLSYVLRHNHDNKPVMICVHHQPVTVGSEWIDQYIIKNASSLFELIAQFPQVKILSWGHVHQEFTAKRGDVHMFATPSTCVQFKPLCKNFTVDTQMPGYRWFQLNNDGSFTTGVHRVTGKSYVIDYKSAGY